MNLYIVGLLFVFADIFRGANTRIFQQLWNEKKNWSKPFFDSSEHSAQKADDKITSKMLLHMFSARNF